MQSSLTSSESPKRERQLARYSYGAKLLESSPHVIYHAFAHAIHEHPALGIAVTKDDKQTLFFQRLRSINLEEAITFQTLPENEQEQERRLITLSAEENSRGFKDTSNKPLWRAIVLRNNPASGDKHTFRIAFFWHHLIGDGRSGLAVHQTLLEAISSFGKDVDCKTNRPPTDGIDITRVPTSTKPFFVSMEQALPTASAPTVDKAANGVVQCEKWTGGRFNYQHPVVTQLAHVRLPAEGVQRVLGQCRRNNTTMTALLQAVVGKALLDNVEPDRLRTAVAVSLRRFFSPPVDDSVMGLWISTYTLEYHRSQFTQKSGGSSALWDIAKKNMAKINETIEDGGKNVEIMSLMGIDDYEAVLKPKAGKPRDNSFGLTNLGVFGKAASQPRGKQGVVIDDMVFSQSCHANGAAFTICVVTVEGCDMNIVFNWQEGIVASETMEAVADGVRACLTEVGNEFSE
ncbi:hypothetical protein ABW19_dt0207564 [Dactylella cylindrospora]|nr:hypothetical protein ABW19_dt0207564 [Dactylella cylindrospora]